MSALGRGLSLLFQAGRKRIGNAVDNFLLDADAKKAIRDEVEKKYKDSLNRVQTVKDAKAANIKELDDKYKASIDELKNKQDKWQQDYNSARDAKKQEMDSALADWNKTSSDINSNLAQARKMRDDYINNYMSDLNYDNTVFIDTSGRSFIIDPLNSFSKIPVDSKWLNKHKSYDTKFIGTDGKLINLFDDNSVDSFTKALTPNSQLFNYIISKKNSVRNMKEYKQLDEAVQNLETEATKYSSASTPKTFDDYQFAQDYNKINGNMPTGYEFNGKSYKDQAELDLSYNSAIKYLRDRSRDLNKRYIAMENKRDAEIAQRIQDAKDIKKAKLALGAGVGAGALFAGAKAMYGGDDTDNIDNTDNTDNIDAYTGEADPNLKLENTPEGKTAYTGKSLVDTGFDPDKAEAEAILAGAAYDKGVEDGNSIRSSGDLGNNIGATTRGHTMDDRLYELIKAMKDPYKADAIANYIYSRHGDDPEVQNLGWRGWLNKYYGDSLRSIMNIDPSGYKGMHISGGL